MPPSPRTAFNRSPLIRTLISLGACRAWGVDSENRPQRGQFLPDLQPHSPAIGQKDGEKLTAAVDSQPTIPKPDSLLDSGLHSGPDSAARPAHAEGIDGGQTPAQRLGHWLDWTDAISLYGVLNSEINSEPAAQPASASHTSHARPSRTPASAAVLAAELRHLRQQLGQLIDDDAALAAELAEPANLANPGQANGGAATIDRTPGRRGHLALQQTQAARITPLRASLQARAPALARLAALDALLESALAERQRHLLAKVPRLLEKHVAQRQRAPALRSPPTEPGALAPAPAPVAPHLQPAALRQMLQQLLQQLLRDELALHLQSLEGLLLALQHDTPCATP